MPCVLQGQTWTRVLRPTDDASGMTAVTRLLTDSSTSLATTEFVQKLASATYVGPYLSNTACASDQTSRINALSASLPAGAWLIFPRQACILITGTLTNTRQVWEGAGGVAGTTIAFSAPTGTAVKLMGDGATLKGFHLYNSVGTTSSVGVQMSDKVENPTRQRIEDVYVHDFTNNIYVESGYFWSWHRVWSRNFRKYGGLIRNMNYNDNGDWSIVDFVSQYDNVKPDSGTAGLRAESGGSGKIVNSKFLGAQYGIDWFQLDALVTTPPAGGTGILQIANSSLENQSKVGISVQAENIYQFGSVTITGNEIFDQPKGIFIGKNIFNVSISGNVFPRNDTAVEIGDGAHGVTVVGNNFRAFNTGAVSILEGSSDVTVGVNGYATSPGKPRVIDQRAAGAGRIDNAETRPLALTAGSPAQAVYRIDTRQFRSARARLTLEGVIQGVGAASRAYDILLTNTGAAVTTTSLSDTSSSVAPPAMTLAAASDNPQSIVVSVAGARGDFQGSLSISIDGKIVSLKVMR
ncbi:hypothetical protein DA075_17230 [Methylobacterium currus]|uniref:Right-handed parallel beta-helix repeat-containing protein n=1 Tax=Methylobacterium currus TaxID=2051553 RepID=A0A2R4WLL4_9HYPH|nr:hypothetical protein DA075_17230 [Methylobacterium currus]